MCECILYILYMWRYTRTYTHKHEHWSLWHTQTLTPHHPWMGEFNRVHAIFINGKIIAMMQKHTAYHKPQTHRHASRLAALIIGARMRFQRSIFQQSSKLRVKWLYVACVITEMRKKREFLRTQSLDSLICYCAPCATFHPIVVYFPFK